MKNRYSYAIYNKLLQKDNVAMTAINPKEYILVVEGRIDNFFYSRLINEKTETISVSWSIRPKPPNIREAITLCMEEVRNNLSRFKYIKPLGVVDSDYSNTVPDESNLVHTDTNDLETLLFSTGAFDVSLFPGVNETIKKVIECSSYQFGQIRRAIFKYIDQKHLNIRDFIEEEWLGNNFKLFCDPENGINSQKMFETFRKMPIPMKPGEKKPLENDFELELFKMFVFARLRENGEVDSANNLVRNPSNFKKEEITNYWEAIRGHDIGNISKNLSPELITKAREEFSSPDDGFVLDSFIAYKSDPQRIKNTKLFKTFNSWGIV